MRLSFIFPAALWLLVLLLPLWALALAVPRRLSPSRFWASLALRSALICTLVLALAGTQLVRGVDGLTTVFLIDSSDSISPSARGQAEAFVQDALRAMLPDDRAAVVVFGENALVERAPNAEQNLGRLNSVPVVARTNIQSALELGLALFPAETQKRIVLLSDGGENAGQALEAARLATSRHVPISYVDLSTPGGGEALVASLSAPASAREGQKISLVATIESTQAQTARLRIFGGDMVLLEQDVDLQPGPNSYSLEVDAQGQGFQQYRAEIIPQIDNRAQNNQSETLVRVDGPPRVLLVEGQPGEAQIFEQALAAANVGSQTLQPAAIPTDLAGLSDYEAVVLLNVPARDLPVKALAALPTYVRELGKGLVMVGGDRSYGVGGYGRTPVEEALPVYMDVRDREERPDLGLVFVIDKSGSMDSCHCSGPNRQTAQFRRGGTPKLDIAKDAVLQASSVLHERDMVGVVAFDGNAQWALPLERGPTSDVVQEAIAPMAPEGSTNVRAGLLAAEDSLLNADVRIKHAILLTDGWSGGGDNLEIAERMRNAGITLSVVAAGGGSADYLEQLAEAGGGRYYAADDMEDVPQIFVQETITAVGNYLIEEPFTPAYAAPSPVLEGLDTGLPQLYGYNGTTIKETASMVLVGIDDAPVLAQWQYGLGRSLAWTSDAKGKWAKDWVSWAGFPRFAAQLIGWVLPRGSGGGLSAEFHSEGAQTVMQVDVRDQNGQPRDDLAMRATIVGANGTPIQVPLTQVAPGEYRASVASPIQGTYLVQLVGMQDNQVVVQDTSGLVVPYSPEYRQGQSNSALLAALADMTGGAALSEAAAAFDHNLAVVSQAQEIALPLLLLALLLLPFDIAVRRLVLRRSDVSDTAALLRGRLARPAPPPPSDSGMRRLHSAKSRAAQRFGEPPPSAPPESPPSDEALSRLHAARDRARRRARGEE